MDTSEETSVASRVYREVPFTVTRTILYYQNFYTNSETAEVVSDDLTLKDTNIIFKLFIKKNALGKLNINLRLSNISVPEIILKNYSFDILKPNGVHCEKRTFDTPRILTEKKPELIITTVDGRNPTNADISDDVQTGKLTFRVSGNFLVMDGQPGTLGDAIETLLNEKETSDVTLSVGTKKFHAHKFILAARSPVFGLMFYSAKMAETKGDFITIVDTEPNVFQEFLRFLYTDDTPALKNMAPDLLILADRYNVDMLKELCENRMLLTISLGNCLNYYLKSVLGNAKMVSEKSVQVIKKNFVVVRESQEWKEMDVRSSIKLMSILETFPA